MRNIPMFTVESGVASLILEEIPYKKIAYIRLQATETPEALLDECVSFCKAVGAERIYATGHDCLDEYPLYTQICELYQLRSQLPSTECVATQVKMDNLNEWLALYNERMAAVPNVATMTYALSERYITDKHAYFVYDRDVRIGLGVVSTGRLDALASLMPGRGADVLCALSKELSGDSVTVEVAVTNEKAMSLYQRLGFANVKEISRWYEIL